MRSVIRRDAALSFVRPALTSISGLAVASVCLVALASSALAEEVKIGENPVSAILKWRPTTPDPQVQDFVKGSRPAGELKYAPLTAPKVERPPLKSGKDLKAMVDGMDGRAAGVRGKGAAAAGSSAGASTTRQLQAAAAESRRRAAEAFGSTPGGK